jgi:hypothetical protein
VARLYHGPRASEKPAPCTADAGRKRRSVPERDAPISRAAEAAGRILCRPILGGLHHQYARASEGFDVKILKEIIKLRKQDKDERDERDTLLDMYMRAMETAGPELAAKAA